MCPMVMHRSIITFYHSFRSRQEIGMTPQMPFPEFSWNDLLSLDIDMIYNTYMNAIMCAVLCWFN